MELQLFDPHIKPKNERSSVAEEQVEGSVRPRQLI